MSPKKKIAAGRSVKVAVQAAAEPQVKPEEKRVGGPLIEYLIMQAVKDLGESQVVYEAPEKVVYVEGVGNTVGGTAWAYEPSVVAPFVCYDDEERLDADDGWTGCSEEEESSDLFESELTLAMSMPYVEPVQAPTQVAKEEFPPLPAVMRVKAKAQAPVVAPVPKVTVPKVVVAAVAPKPAGEWMPWPKRKFGLAIHELKVASFRGEDLPVRGVDVKVDKALLKIAKRWGRNSKVAKKAFFKALLDGSYLPAVPEWYVSEAHALHYGALMDAAWRCGQVYKPAMSAKKALKVYQRQVALTPRECIAMVGLPKIRKTKVTEVAPTKANKLRPVREVKRAAKKPLPVVSTLDWSKPIVVQGVSEAFKQRQMESADRAFLLACSRRTRARIARRQELDWTPVQSKKASNGQGIRQRGIKIARGFRKPMGPTPVTTGAHARFQHLATRPRQVIAKTYTEDTYVAKDKPDKRVVVRRYNWNDPLVKRLQQKFPNLCKAISRQQRADKVKPPAPPTSFAPFLHECGVDAHTIAAGQRAFKSWQKRGSVSAEKRETFLRCKLKRIVELPSVEHDSVVPKEARPWMPEHPVERINNHELMIAKATSLAQSSKAKVAQVAGTVLAAVYLPDSTTGLVVKNGLATVATLVDGAVLTTSHGPSEKWTHRYLDIVSTKPVSLGKVGKMVRVNDNWYKTIEQKSRYYSMFKHPVKPDGKEGVRTESEIVASRFAVRSSSKIISGSLVWNENGKVVGMVQARKDDTYFFTSAESKRVTEPTEAAPTPGIRLCSTPVKRKKGAKSKKAPKPSQPKAVKEQPKLTTLVEAFGNLSVAGLNKRTTTTVVQEVRHKGKTTVEKTSVVRSTTSKPKTKNKAKKGTSHVPLIVFMLACLFPVTLGATVPTTVKTGLLDRVSSNSEALVAAAVKRQFPSKYVSLETTCQSWRNNTDCMVLIVEQMTEDLEVLNAKLETKMATLKDLQEFRKEFTGIDNPKKEFNDAKTKATALTNKFNAAITEYDELLSKYFKLSGEVLKLGQVVEKTIKRFDTLVSYVSDHERLGDNSTWAEVEQENIRLKREIDKLDTAVNSQTNTVIPDSTTTEAITVTPRVHSKRESVINVPSFDTNTGTVSLYRNVTQFLAGCESFNCFVKGEDLQKAENKWATTYVLRKSNSFYNVSHVTASEMQWLLKNVNDVNSLLEGLGIQGVDVADGYRLSKGKIWSIKTGAGANINVGDQHDMCINGLAQADSMPQLIACNEFKQEVTSTKVQSWLHSVNFQLPLSVLMIPLVAFINPRIGFLVALYAFIWELPRVWGDECQADDFVAGSLFRNDKHAKITFSIQKGSCFTHHDKSYMVDEIYEVRPVAYERRVLSSKIVYQNMDFGCYAGKGHEVCKVDDACGPCGSKVCKTHCQYVDSFPGDHCAVGFIGGDYVFGTICIDFVTPIVEVFRLLPRTAIFIVVTDDMGTKVSIRADESAAHLNHDGIVAKSVQQKYSGDHLAVFNGDGYIGFEPSYVENLCYSLESNSTLGLSRLCTQVTWEWDRDAASFKVHIPAGDVLGYLKHDFVKADDMTIKYPEVWVNVSSAVIETDTRITKAHATPCELSTITMDAEKALVKVWEASTIAVTTTQSQCSVEFSSEDCDILSSRRLSIKTGQVKKLIVRCMWKNNATFTMSNGNLKKNVTLAVPYQALPTAAMFTELVDGVKAKATNFGDSAAGFAGAIKNNLSGVVHKIGNIFSWNLSQLLVTSALGVLALMSASGGNVVGAGTFGALAVLAWNFAPAFAHDGEQSTSVSLWFFVGLFTASLLALNAKKLLTRLIETCEFTCPILCEYYAEVIWDVLMLSTVPINYVVSRCAAIIYRGIVDVYDYRYPTNSEITSERRRRVVPAIVGRLITCEGVSECEYVPKGLDTFLAADSGRHFIVQVGFTDDGSQGIIDVEDNGSQLLDADAEIKLSEYISAHPAHYYHVFRGDAADDCTGVIHRTMSMWCAHTYPTRVGAVMINDLCTTSALAALSREDWSQNTGWALRANSTSPSTGWKMGEVQYISGLGLVYTEEGLKAAKSGELVFIKTKRGTLKCLPIMGQVAKYWILNHGQEVSSKSEWKFVPEVFEEDDEVMAQLLHIANSDVSGETLNNVNYSEHQVSEIAELFKVRAEAQSIVRQPVTTDITIPCYRTEEPEPSGVDLLADAVVIRPVGDLTPKDDESDDSTTISESSPFFKVSASASFDHLKSVNYYQHSIRSLHDMLFNEYSAVFENTDEGEFWRGAIPLAHARYRFKSDNTISSLISRVYFHPRCWVGVFCDTCLSGNCDIMLQDVRSRHNIDEECIISCPIAPALQSLTPIGLGEQWVSALRDFDYSAAAMLASFYDECSKLSGERNATAYFENLTSGWSYLNTALGRHPEVAANVTNARLGLGCHYSINSLKIYNFTIKVIDADSGTFTKPKFTIMSEATITKLRAAVVYAKAFGCHYFNIDLTRSADMSLCDVLEATFIDRLLFGDTFINLLLPVHSPYMKDYMLLMQQGMLMKFSEPAAAIGIDTMDAKVGISQAATADDVEKWAQVTNTAWDIIDVTKQGRGLRVELSEGMDEKLPALVTAEQQLTLLQLECYASACTGFIYGGAIVTAHHGTKGNSIYLTCRGNNAGADIADYEYVDYKFRAVDQDRSSDIAQYGKRVDLDDPAHNRIYLAANPHTQQHVWLLCKSKGVVKSGRTGSEFSVFLPITIDWETKKVNYTSTIPDTKGLSGAPIVGVGGEVVGVYGLLDRVVSFDYQRNENIQSYAAFAGRRSVGVKREDYFRRAVDQFVSGEHPEGTRYLLCAPTGTGKSTSFVCYLAKKLKDQVGTHTIAIVQPTVPAAANCFNMVKMLLPSVYGPAAINRVSLNLILGEKAATGYTDKKWGVDTGELVINVATGGKFLADTSSSQLGLLKHQYTLIDEVHELLVNEDIGGAWALTQSNRFAGKVCYLTATMVPQVNHDVRLCADSQLESTIKPISDEKLTTWDIEREIDVTKYFYLKRDLLHVPKGYVVPPFFGLPMNDVKSTRVLVYFPSQSDCDRGKQWVNATYGKAGMGLKAEVLYRGNDTIASLPPHCVIFATGYASTAITISGVSCVMDMGLTYRPNVDLALNVDHIRYEKKTELVLITQEEADQRRGRTGRTCAGKVYRLPSFAPVEKIDFAGYFGRVFFNCLVKMRESGGLVAALSDCRPNSLASKMVEYDWLCPNKLSCIITSKRHKEGEDLDFQSKIETGLNDKLNICRGVQTDQLWAYLSFGKTYVQRKVFTSGQLANLLPLLETPQETQEFLDEWMPYTYINTSQMTEDLKTKFSVYALTDEVPATASALARLVSTKRGSNDYVGALSSIIRQCSDRKEIDEEDKAEALAILTRMESGLGVDTRPGVAPSQQEQRAMLGIAPGKIKVDESTKRRNPALAFFESQDENMQSVQAPMGRRISEKPNMGGKSGAKKVDKKEKTKAQDPSDKPREHEHKCTWCDRSYIHTHKYRNPKHQQFRMQCPWEDCVMRYKDKTYAGNPKKVLGGEQEHASPQMLAASVLAASFVTGCVGTMVEDIIDGSSSRRAIAAYKTNLATLPNAMKAVSEMKPKELSWVTQVVKFMSESMHHVMRLFGDSFLKVVNTIRKAFGMKPYNSTEVYQSQIASLMPKITMAGAAIEAAVGGIPNILIGAAGTVYGQLYTTLSAELGHTFASLVTASACTLVGYFAGMGGIAAMASSTFVSWLANVIIRGEYRRVINNATVNRVKEGISLLGGFAVGTAVTVVMAPLAKGAIAAHAASAAQASSTLGYMTFAVSPGHQVGTQGGVLVAKHVYRLMYDGLQGDSVGVVALVAECAAIAMSHGTSATVWVTAAALGGGLAIIRSMIRRGNWWESFALTSICKSEKVLQWAQEHTPGFQQNWAELIDTIIDNGLAMAALIVNPASIISILAASLNEIIQGYIDNGSLPMGGLRDIAYRNYIIYSGVSPVIGIVTQLIGCLWRVAGLATGSVEDDGYSTSSEMSHSATFLQPIYAYLGIGTAAVAAPMILPIWVTVGAGVAAAAAAAGVAYAVPPVRTFITDCLKKAMSFLMSCGSWIKSIWEWIFGETFSDTAITSWVPQTAMQYLQERGLSEKRRYKVVSDSILAVRQEIKPQKNIASEALVSVGVNLGIGLVEGARNEICKGIRQIATKCKDAVISRNAVGLMDVSLIRNINHQCTKTMCGDVVSYRSMFSAEDRRVLEEHLGVTWAQWLCYRFNTNCLKNLDSLRIVEGQLAQRLFEVYVARGLNFGGNEADMSDLNFTMNRTPTETYADIESNRVPSLSECILMVGVVEPRGVLINRMMIRYYNAAYYEWTRNLPEDIGEAKTELIKRIHKELGEDAFNVTADENMRSSLPSQRVNLKFCPIDANRAFSVMDCAVAAAFLMENDDPRRRKDVFVLPNPLATQYENNKLRDVFLVEHFGAFDTTMITNESLKSACGHLFEIEGLRSDGTTIIDLRVGPVSAMGKTIEACKVKINMQYTHNAAQLVMVFTLRTSAFKNIDDDYLGHAVCLWHKVTRDNVNCEGLILVYGKIQGLIQAAFDQLLSNVGFFKNMKWTGVTSNNRKISEAHLSIIDRIANEHEASLAHWEPGRSAAVMNQMRLVRAACRTDPQQPITMDEEILSKVLPTVLNIVSQRFKALEDADYANVKWRQLMSWKHMKADILAFSRSLETDTEKKQRLGFKMTKLCVPENFPVEWWSLCDAEYTKLLAGLQSNRFGVGKMVDIHLPKTVAPAGDHPAAWCAAEKLSLQCVSGRINRGLLWAAGLYSGVSVVLRVKTSKNETRDLSKLPGRCCCVLEVEDNTDTGMISCWLWKCSAKKAVKLTREKNDPPKPVSATDYVSAFSAPLLTAATGCVWKKCKNFIIKPKEKDAAAEELVYNPPEVLCYCGIFETTLHEEAPEEDKGGVQLLLESISLPVLIKEKADVDTAIQHSRRYMDSITSYVKRAYNLTARALMEANQANMTESLLGQLSKPDTGNVRITSYPEGLVRMRKPRQAKNIPMPDALGPKVLVKKGLTKLDRQVCIDELEARLPGGSQLTEEELRLVFADADGPTKDAIKTFISTSEEEVLSNNAPWVSGDKDCSMRAPAWWDYLYDGNMHRYRPASMDPEFLRTLIRSTHNYLGRFPKKDYDRLGYYGRMQLPLRVEDGRDTVYASRGALKMQQLVESDPAFFNDCKAYFDLTCGYGGFEQYLTWRYRNAAPRKVLYSTLVDQRAAEPNIELMQEHGSNCKAIAAKPPGDKADIRSPKTISWARKVIEEHQVDMLILDMSEVKGEVDKEVRWWTQEPLYQGGKSRAEAVTQLVAALPEGGKMLCKLLWGGQEMCYLVHQLTALFKGVKVRKLPTSKIGNREYYLYCVGKRSFSSKLERAALLTRCVNECIRDDMVHAKNLYQAKGLGFAKPKKADWFLPSSGQVLYHILQPDNDKRVEDGLPLGEMLELDYTIPKKCPLHNHNYVGKCANKCVYGMYEEVRKVSQKWEPHWGRRISAMKNYVRFINDSAGKSGRKIRFDMMVRSGDWECLKQIGRFQVKDKVGGIKHTTNALISSYMSEVAGITWKNATYGHTQQDRESVRVAKKKRLDKEAGSPSPLSLKKLATAMELLLSTHGRSLEGQLRYMTEDEVKVFANSQGSTGILDPGHNIEDFMKLHPDWYSLAMTHFVNKWENREPTGGYFSCRLKPEPKGRKDVQAESSRLDYDLRTVTPEELEQGSNLTPRFIQFADTLQRLAHIIVYGQLLEQHNKAKVYKTSVSGLPPHQQGKVTRTYWDMFNPENQKMVKVGENVDLGVRVQPNLDFADRFGRFETASQELFVKTGGLARHFKQAGKTKIIVVTDDTEKVQQDLKDFEVEVVSCDEHLKNLLTPGYKDDLVCFFGDIKNTDALRLQKLYTHNYVVHAYKTPAERLVALSHTKTLLYQQSGISKEEIELLAANDAHGKMPAAVGTDFSSLDCTITAAERMLAAKVWSRMYQTGLMREAVLSASREMAYPIVVNDQGEMWVRKGQRGSGEILTSIENSFIVAANIACAISEALGISLNEVLCTVGFLSVKSKTDRSKVPITTLIGGKAHHLIPPDAVYDPTLPSQPDPNAVYAKGIKRFEFGGVPFLVDGDDVVIFSDLARARRIFKYLNKETNFITSTGKSLRSGNEAGAALFQSFEKVEFCSHSYTGVFVGANAKDAHFSTKNAEAAVERNLLTAKQYNFNIEYMPCRAVAHCLSKMMMTLKTATAKWDPEDKRPNGCVDVTQSKVLSYLLLYPHLRPVRWTCLTILAAIGTEEATMRELKRRYGNNLDWIDFHKKNLTTVLSAFHSVYGVLTLDDISFRAYDVDTSDLRDLRYNASLLRRSCPVTKHGWLSKSFTWLKTVGIRSIIPLTYDSSIYSSWIKEESEHSMERVEVEDPLAQYILLVARAAKRAISSVLGL